MSEADNRDESETIGKLADALAKAQAVMKPAAKDSTNPHYNSKYADLASIHEACREPLSSNGIAVTQRVTSSMEGVRVSTKLIHASGEWMKDSLFLPVTQKTPQGFGSAITYARRYSLAAMVGIAAEEDDDGNAASAPQAKTAPPANGSRTAAVTAKLSAKVAKAKEPEAPPPPSDADFNQEPDGQGNNGLTEAGPPMSFGNSKGIPLSKLSDKELNWYERALESNVNDPAKARFRSSNLAALDAIRRELGTRN